MGYVPQAQPARQIWVSGTTLYDVAAQYLGDATQWYRIGQLNGIDDPWITGLVQIVIPRLGTSNGGVPNYSVSSGQGLDTYIDEPDVVVPAPPVQVSSIPSVFMATEDGSVLYTEDGSSLQAVD